MKRIAPAELWELLPAVLLIVGCVGLLADARPVWPWWLLAWVAVAWHYARSLRDGVLRTGFLIFRRTWTIHQGDSPLLFLVAAVVEGLFLAGLTLALLVSL
jgi:hypothetical protein